MRGGPRTVEVKSVTLRGQAQQRGVLAKFANCDVWEEGPAPNKDVLGKLPLLTGQQRRESFIRSNVSVMTRRLNAYSPNSAPEIHNYIIE